MFRELKIKVGTLEKKLYLRTGVERFSNHVSTIHKHRAAEVHVISAGTVSFLVEGKAYTVRAGEVFVIPPLQTHMCSSASEENRYANFYVEVPLDAPLRFGAGPGIAEAFIRQCEESQKQSRQQQRDGECHRFCHAEHPRERVSERHKHAIGNDPGYGEADFTLIVYFFQQFCLPPITKRVAACENKGRHMRHFTPKFNTVPH